METGRHADVPRYGLLAITPSCVNRGNLIIEHAARRVLDLAQPLVEVDAHRPLTRAAADALNGCRAVLLPGATLLQPEDHEAVARLSWLQVPVVAFGTALRSLSGIPDLAVASRIGTVIGSRDPFTHQALTEAGLPSRLVGCPVLLLASAPGWRPREGPIVYSPGLGGQEIQEACARACAEIAPTVLLLHAPERQRPVVPGLTVAPLDGAEQALELIRGASVVVTSRMHAYLTALLFGVPALFLGGWYDSRYSLLEYLGVPIEPPVPERVRRLVTGCLDGSRLPPAACFERADRLRAAQADWLEEVGAPLGLRLREEAQAVAGGVRNA
jgi:hypothetical protein